MRTTRRCWNTASESVAEVWLTSFWPTSLQKSPSLLCSRGGKLPWFSRGSVRESVGLWQLHNHQWSCVTWSTCVLLISFVHSACDCALIWQLSTSGTSTWGASATSAAQTEVRPSNSFPHSREETSAFPPFIRHAPPLRAVCELCLSPVQATLFLPPFFSSSVAGGGALSYFLINKGSIVLYRRTREEYPLMYYTVH